MPIKILTDVPTTVGKTADALVGTAWLTLVEAPYFSRTGVRNRLTATIDPDDNERELLAGELFLRTPLHVTNETDGDVTVSLRIVRESGATRLLCNQQVINGRKTIYLPEQGILLFKRNLADPAAAGDRLQLQASVAASVGVVFSYSEKEALDHAPNTEV